MGHWHEESGEIILPSAEFAAVRQAVQSAVHAHQEKIFEGTQEFWKGLTRKEQTDPTAYSAAVHRLGQARQVKLEAQRRYSFRAWDSEEDALGSEVEGRLFRALHGGPSRVLKSDMDFPTNRTTSFGTGDGWGSLSFDRATNTVHWYTGEVRDVDDSRNSVAGAAFFARLKNVKWTRGTGGVFTGDSELNREETDRGRYATSAYGPIGAAREPSHCEEYTDSKGNRVTRNELRRLQEAAWAGQRKEMNRAAKAANNAGRAKTTAASNRGSYAAYTHAEPTIRLN